MNANLSSEDVHKLKEEMKLNGKFTPYQSIAKIHLSERSSRTLIFSA